MTARAQIDGPGQFRLVWSLVLAIIGLRTLGWLGVI